MRRLNLNTKRGRDETGERARDRRGEDSRQRVCSGKLSKGEMTKEGKIVIVTNEVSAWSMKIRQICNTMVAGAKKDD